MKICHVITRLIIGGAQENTLLTCEGLHDRGHDVLLLAGPDAGAEGSLWSRARAHGYQVREVSSMHRAVRPLRDLAAVAELRRAFADHKPDVVHTHSSKAGILGRQAAASAGRRVVHTIHGMSFNRTQPWWTRTLYRVLERRAARQTDVIVTVAEAMARQARQAGLMPPAGFTTVYSGMQTEWFTPNPARRRTARQRFGAGDGDVVAGTVARLSWHKGYEQLIPAIAEAAAADPRLLFVWVGDGDQRDDYLNRVERCKLAGRVHLTGLATPRQVADHMQGFDVLVHCSQWEGLPRAVVQALLLEIPAISFDIDGAPEVVLDGVTGRLVPLNDIAGLAAALLQLAADPSQRRRLGQCGRARCLRMFDHRSMVDRLERLYCDLLASGGVL